MLTGFQGGKLMAKDVTIQDVANKVGVSKTTVSRYLNGRFGNMSHETRQMIKEVIEELNYRPNRQAQSLKTKKSHLLGLMVADIENSYSGYWIKAMQEKLVDTDYQLMIMTSNNSEEQELHNIRKLLDQNIDGMMLQPVTMDAEKYRFLYESNLPVVLIDRTLKANYWPTIQSNNFQITKQLAEEIVSHGYERIVHISEPIGNVSPRLERYDAMKLVAHEYHLELLTLEVDGSQEVVDYFIKGIDYQARKTAFFGANGTMLNQIIKAFRRNKMSFPKDCGICGYDDLMIGEVLMPTLTAISQKPELIGKRSTEVLLEMINGNLTNENIDIPATLHLRESL